MVIDISITSTGLCDLSHDERRSILIDRLNQNSIRAKKRNLSNKKINEIFEENYLLENLLMNPPEQNIPKTEKNDKKCRKNGKIKIKLLPGHLKMNQSLKKLYNSVCKNKKTVKPKFYSRYKDFEAMPQYDFDKPVVRCSGPYEVKEQKQPFKRFITAFAPRNYTPSEGL